MFWLFFLCQIIKIIFFHNECSLNSHMPIFYPFIWLNEWSRFIDFKETENCKNRYSKLLML